MKAHAWDDIGPKRDCLLRLVWSDGSGEWSEFVWRDADAEPDGEGGWNGHPDGYWQKSSDLSVNESHDWGSYTGKFDHFSDLFTVSHWAELPAIEGEP
jgi:hypothetical protein